MQKTALLTGYSGFLGRYTLQVLVDAGWKVLLAGRKPPAGDLHARYLHIDLNRPESLAALRDILPVQVIVHLACRVAWNGVSDSDLLASNVLATGLLADLSRTWGAQMIFASSAVVHGVAESLISSRSAVSLDTPYAKSKRLGEELVEASGTDHCILRMGGLFGRSGPGHLGLNRAIDLTLMGQAPTVVGRGTARRNYLFVKDAAEAIVAAAEQRIQGTHLVGGPDALSIGTMLDLICDILNPGLRPTQKDGPEARDQIIERSSTFDAGVTFAAALRDIREEALGCVSD